jgi:ubiquinone/menaquinone biosynthesis C-methylase UbiE
VNRLRVSRGADASCEDVKVAEFDQVAECYDLTRGGELRGDEYAADIDALLPTGEGPILEIGIGTGVVARGLARRGRSVVGVDISLPMLIRAKQRLGPMVVLGDAMEMGVATGSVAHAVSVWVVHSVEDPKRLFQEAARAIRPTRIYVLCLTQNPDEDDAVGQIISAMGERVDRARQAPRPRGATVDEALDWAASAGWEGTLRQIRRSWNSSPRQEVFAIEQRSWPALRELDEATLEEITRPAIDVLSALPETDQVRRATSDLLILRRA